MKTNEKSRMDGTWLFPILAISGSALSMTAIGILLAHFNGQPIFDWNGVTLNAIIAVFSVMSKAMLAYTLSECLGQAKWIWFSSRSRPLNDIDLIDSASRGPLGSFQILTRSAAARSFISMGAIIVILSTVMDPFIQLTIGQENTVAFGNNSNVQIAYANRFSKKWIIMLDGYLQPPMDNLKMQSAILEGLSQPDAWISQQTQHSCPSGNCTWDTFTSLAICSACNDVTNQIEKIHLGIPKGSVGQPPEGEQSDLTFMYVLPNGLGGNYEISMAGLGSVDRNESVSFTSFDTLIWSMTMMNVTKKEKPTGDFSVSVSATECGLWYCVNSYQAAVKNGKFIETIRPAPSKKNPDSWLPITNNGTASVVAPLEFVFDERPPVESILNNTAFDGYQSPAHKGPLDVPETIELDVRTDLQLGEGFNVSQAAILTIASLLRDTFADPDIKRDYLGSYPIKFNALVKNTSNEFNDPTSEVGEGPPIYLPAVMENLYHSQNLEVTFSSLAKSLTNHIRQNSDNQTVIHGKEGHSVVLIRVRPWFLTLPIILIFVGAVFLGIILHYTHMSEMKFWGTSTLPIVVLGGKLGPIFDDKDMKENTMKEKAKRQFVQFPTLQPGNEDHEMISPSRISVISNPSTDVVSIGSPSRTSGLQTPSADVASIDSPPPTSETQSPSAVVAGIGSPPPTSEVQSPSAVVTGIGSPPPTSEVQSPSADVATIGSISPTSPHQTHPLIRGVLHQTAYNQ